MKNIVKIIKFALNAKIILYKTNQTISVIVKKDSFIIIKQINVKKIFVVFYAWIAMINIVLNI